MLVFFQNCTAGSQDRNLANYEDKQIINESPAEPEATYRIDKNLKIK